MMHFEGRALDDSDPLFSPLISLNRQKGLAYWKPSRKWVAAGFKGTPIRLTGKLGDGKDALRAAECRTMTRAMLVAIHGEGNPHLPQTWGWLIHQYLHDRLSPIQEVKANTRANYAETCDYWMRAIGKTTVAETDYSTLHGIKTTMQDKGRSVSFIHRKFTMLRGLAKFGSLQKDPKLRAAAREVRLALSDMRFETPAARQVSPTYDQIMAVVDRADAEGHFAFGTGLLIQWHFMLRGNDVFGHYLEDKGTGGVRRTVRKKNGSTHEERWQDGLTWDMFEPGLAGFSKVISKTRKKLPEAMRFGFEDLPALQARLRLLANGSRIGPVILTRDTGVPFTREWRSHLFRHLADDAKLPRNIAMMDTRAGAITEGSKVADVKSLRDAAGHMNSNTTQRYMRDRAETAASVVTLRVSARNRNS